MGRTHAFPHAAPSYMGPGVGGFMLAGVVYLGYLYARDRRQAGR